MDHWVVGRRIRLLRDHIVRWKNGKPIVLHVAGTEAVVIDALQDPQYPYPVLIIDVPGYQPHPICVKSQVSDGVWDVNIELLLG